MTRNDALFLLSRHYHEVLEVFDRLFQHIFNGLNEHYKAEIEAVKRQFPFNDLKYETGKTKDPATGEGKRSKIFTFREAIDLLRKFGGKVVSAKNKELEKQIRSGELNESAIRNLMDVVEQNQVHAATLPEKPYLEDLSTKDEKVLGQVVLEQ